MHFLRLRTLCCILPLIVAACAVGPAYQRPALPAEAAWLTPNNLPTPTTEWWRGFGSPVLDRYLGQAKAANNDLAAAMARVRQADAQLRIAGAALLPTLAAGVDVTHQRQPVSGAGVKTYTSYAPGLTASYALDFWGKNAAARAAAEASADASRYDRVTVELTVMTGVATSYFEALALQDRLAVAEDNLASAQTILRGLQLQERAGTVTALDVAQQETTVASLDAAIPPLRQQLRQTQDALAILIGQTPDHVTGETGGLAGLAYPAIGAGLPSELLARRPDVAEAEAQLIAANANIAVARAAFYPSISLTATGGFASTALSSLFNPASMIFTLGAGLTQPIFEGGALAGQYDLSQARYDELLADYRKAVLSAFGNVEDALVAVQQSAEQAQRQEIAVAKARRAYEIAQAQMRAGTISILTVLNTETALFTAQDALIQTKYARLQALVDLFSALGGGWQQA